jgi:hypothetical protein
MIYKFEIFKLLENTRVDSLKNKYVNKLKIDKTTFDKFIDFKAASEWLLKIYNSTDKETMKDIESQGYKFDDLLISFSKFFFNNKDFFAGVIEKIQDIKSFDNLLEVFNKIDKYNIYNDLDNESKEDVIIYDNSYEYAIFKPLSYDISDKYGNRAWCVVRDKNVFEDDFDYGGKMGRLTYIINKLNHDKDFTIQIQDDEFNLWDAQDNNQIISESLDKIKDYFKNNEENVIYNILSDNEESIKEYNHEIIMDYDEIKENIKNTPLKELVNDYGINIFYYIKDRKFIDAVKYDEYDIYSQDDVYEYYKNEFEDFVNDTYNSNFLIGIKRLMNDFKDELENYYKNEDEENELPYGDLDDENNFKYTLIDYVNDNISDKEFKNFMDNKQCLDDFIHYLLDEKYDDMDAKDYYEEIYGKYYGTLEDSFISQIEWYIDCDYMAKDIINSWDDESLRIFM